MSPDSPSPRSTSTSRYSFTGSTKVGRKVGEAVARRFGRSILELGGNAGLIVTEDADLDLAIPGIIEGMRYTRQGQACTAGTRVFVHEAVYDEVTHGFWLWVDQDRETREGPALDAWQRLKAFLSKTLR